MVRISQIRAALVGGLLCVTLGVQASAALCPASAPALGTAVRGALPLFPADHWWNLDILNAPVDANSAAYIAYIDNGGTRKLHPDFGGEASPGSVAIYGMPYAVVDSSQLKLAVNFQYWDESDGVDLATGLGKPFYPIPLQAITQPHWVEGGAPGNVDQRSSGDRHLLMVDCSNNHLYELYNVAYSSAQGRWLAGSGAFFDMNSNARRPLGWTSADAAGLAIFPGLVRYDEAYNTAVAEIGHALRVTVRATNGFVWPASHRAGTTTGALPMGARLRLKASVNGVDPSQRSSDANVQKIFRAMQRHGLIVADNGSDMYISGTFDTRWNNDVLNPAFAKLTASDFEVVQLGWNPVGVATVLNALAVQPASVLGGISASGSVTLSAAAPAGGAVVALASNHAAVRVPSSVSIAQGVSSASFAITTTPVAAATLAGISAIYQGITRSATLSVSPVAVASVASLSITPAKVVGGRPASGSVTLNGTAADAGLVVALKSSNPVLLALPAQVTVPAGASSATFALSSAPTSRNRTVTVTASAAGRSVTTAVTVLRR